MKRSNHYHKHQLKDDDFSKERRSWYSTMQQPFMENYENFQKLQAIAQQEDELHSESKELTTTIDHSSSSKQAKNEKYHETIIERSQTFIPLNSRRINHGRSEFIALLFPGIGTSHSVFLKLVESKLSSKNILAYGVCLPGRMHRVNDPNLPTIRHVSYQLYEELNTLQFIQHYQQLGKKIIFIGYSYGCLLAYELIRLFLNDGLRESIIGFIAISCRSPVKQTKYNIDREGQLFYHTEFNDIHLIEQIKQLDALPPLFLSCNELLKKFVHFFRYEFQLLETYLMEPPFIPGQKRSLHDIEQEYRSSYFHHYFTSVLSPAPPTTTLPKIADGKGHSDQRRQTQSKLTSMGSAASISTVSTVSTGKLTATTHQSLQSQQTMNNSAVHSTSVNMTAASSTFNYQSRRKKIDEKLIKFQDEMNEFLEMPVSLFKVLIPIFSISTKNDKIFQNEEDIKSWSSHSSLYHQHYIIEDEGLGHFHMDNNETIDVIDEIVHRLQTETFASEV